MRRYKKLYCGNACAYCNEAASHREHFIPYSFFQHSLVIPSCASCNKLLHDEVCETFGQRCAIIYKRLIVKEYATPERLHRLSHLSIMTAEISLFELKPESDTLDELLVILGVAQVKQRKRTRTTPNLYTLAYITGKQLERNRILGEIARLDR